MMNVAEAIYVDQFFYLRLNNMTHHLSIENLHSSNGPHSSLLEGKSIKRDTVSIRSYSSTALSTPKFVT